MDIVPIRHRRSIRKRGFDYNQPGPYFVTLCTQHRVRIFGTVGLSGLRLSLAGKAAEACWAAVPEHFPGVVLDAFVVMPDHVHGTFWIGDDAGAGAKVGARVGAEVGAKGFSPVPRSPAGTVGSIVRGFKIGVTKWVRANTWIHDVWQRNYYERIVRDERALFYIRRYIANNPDALLRKVAARRGHAAPRQRP